MSIMLDDIPGLNEKVAAAAAREDALRSLPFLGVNLDVAGVEVRQFTLRHFLCLDLCQNPFLCGGTVEPEHIAQFLWTVSPQYNAAGIGRDQFLEKVVELDFYDTCKAIREYLDEAFLDQPSGGKGPSARPCTSFAATLLYRIAKAGLGWSRDQLLDLPMAEIFQYLRCMALEDNPRRTFVNRLSDRARREAVAAHLAAQKAAEVPVDSPVAEQSATA